MTDLSPAELDKKVAALSYEEARSKLVDIVARLEQGNIPLEESLTLWELGEALARRCEAWLDGARARLARAQELTRKAQSSVDSPSLESAANSQDPENEQ
ncbi:exodeoxyribonuclease VII small subunit [Arcanobacterium pluranimalium]|uniref:exodeoxyribonuclease VII small subunit n=1 Tax=Arcanobacterium pluranimalium TaxID=108028 RepID=UPI00195BFE9C|nr:exodeoxyribonuclease VII small subunit [Arcanobacterium pluranimalium]MBM7824820.1 exodeoxyribonuclease VII small subunit [Arcanobacterium pluranimalium]